MSSLFPLHFETGRHGRHQLFLSDEEYSKCLDALTKACTDLFVVDAETKKILLGKRKVHPQPDWWYGAGGRMKPGETPFESAARILKRELGLVLDEDAKQHVRNGGRFLGVGAYSYIWEMREQEPKNHGCADISVVMSIEVTKDEIAKFKFDSQEYEQHAWMDCSEVIHDGSKHPALRRSAADLARARQWEQIVLECKDTSKATTDAQIGSRLRELVKEWTEKDDLLLSAQEDHRKKQKMGSDSA